jgi:hypothetical protein
MQDDDQYYPLNISSNNGLIGSNYDDFMNPRNLPVVDSNYNNNNNLIGNNLNSRDLNNNGNLIGNNLNSRDLNQNLNDILNINNLSSSNSDEKHIPFEFDLTGNQNNTTFNNVMSHRRTYEYHSLLVPRDVKATLSGPNEFELNSDGTLNTQKPIFDRLNNNELHDLKRAHDHQRDHKIFNRTNFNLTGNQRKKTFKYQNRHLVVPQDVQFSYYYRIDNKTKIKSDRGKWVQILSAKWLTSQRRYIWKCKELGTNKILHATYIDGMTGIDSADPNVQRSFKQKHAKKTLCMTSAQQKTFISKLKEIIIMLEKPSHIGRTVTRQIGAHDQSGDTFVGGNPQPDRRRKRRVQNDSDDDDEEEEEEDSSNQRNNVFNLIR